MSHPGVKYKRLAGDVPAPRRAHANDGGVDLTAYAIDDPGDGSSPFCISPGERRTYRTGIAVAIPDGYVGLLFGRSSLGVKRGLDPANAVGVIDAGYRGEVIVQLRNTTGHIQRVELGERIAQLVVVPVDTAPWVEVGDLEDSDRGDGGFGSTGN